MRKKKVKKTYLIMGALGVAVAALAVGLALNVRSGKALQATNDRLQREISANRKTVYVATEDIDAGAQVLDGVNVVQQTVYSGFDHEIYADTSEMGFRALVPIKAGMAVQTNMVGQNEISQDARDYEISVVSLMATQADNDIVDVRILFPDGADYTVLAKKKVKDLTLETSIFYTDMTEDEILRLSSATIDAYMTPGTRLYTTRYIQPTLQEASIPYYPVRTNVIDLVHNDPNILETAQETLNANARLDLERRVTGLQSEDKGQVRSGNSERDEAVSRRIEETVETAAETTAAETTAAPAALPKKKTRETTAAAETTAAETTAVETTAADETLPAETTAAETTAAETTAAAETVPPVIGPGGATILDLNQH